MNRSEGKFCGIRIHHSLTRDTGTLSWDEIKRYHVEHNGWDDIGYHFGIERVDNHIEILSGRPLQFQGAHCVPNNTIGICVVGNFDKVEPHPAILSKLMRLVLGLMLMYDFEPHHIKYHRSFCHKSCPGKLFPDSFLKNVETQYLSLRGMG